ncbi:MAG: S1 family peptidase, partial [Pseudomonadota bacterium]
TMVLSCAVAPGSSGAPVLRGQGADLRVVGVISATVPSAQGARALAAPLGQIFDTLRARLDQSPTE